MAVQGERNHRRPLLRCGFRREAPRCVRVLHGFQQPYGNRKRWGEDEQAAQLRRPGIRPVDTPLQRSRIPRLGLDTVWKQGERLGLVQEHAREREQHKRRSGNPCGAPPAPPLLRRPRGNRRCGASLPARRLITRNSAHGFLLRHAPVRE